MKNLFSISLLTLLSFFLLNSAHAAQELTPVEILIHQGMAVKMGELTGAGSKFSLQKLQGLILPEGVIMKSDCDGIVVKTNLNPKVSDIVKVKIQNSEIEASEFIGFVVQ
jgi:hypothetical protein